MLSLIACCLLHGVGFVADEPKDPPAKLELFAKEAWYKEVEAKEKTFEGKLEFKEPKGVGFGRTNPYRLVMKNETREVYVGAEGKLLKPYIGKQIKLIGKPVDMEVEGRNHKEIWAARLEVVEAKLKERDDKDPANKEPAAKEVKIHAHATWNYAKPDFDGPDGKAQELLITNEKELEKVAGKDAATSLAKLLKNEKIDFEKYSLVVLSGGVQRSGGYKFEITGVEYDAKEKILNVKATLTPPAGAATAVISHPAAVVLVDKFEGKIRGTIKDGKPVKPGVKPIIDPKLDPIDADKAEPETKEVKIIARAPLGGKISPPKFDDEGKQIVFKSAEDMEKALGAKETERALKQLKVEKIDFDKQMVFHVTAGTKGSGGSRVEIDKVVQDPKAKTVTVKWTFHSPKDFATGAITHPGELILVEKLDGEVKFEQSAAKDKAPPKLRDEPLPKAEPKELKITATAPAGFAKVDIDAKNDQKTMIVRSEEEFEKLANKDAVLKSLKLDKIDFKKEMIVGVSGGTKSSGGFRVEIVKVEQSDAKTITVEAILHSPKGAATNAFTHPAAIAVVPTGAGEIKVKWVEPKEKPKEIKLLPKAAPVDDKEKDAKIHASSYWPYGKAGTKVIASEKDLEAVAGKEALANVQKMLKVDKIDFDKQMLVCVSGGIKPTGGYAVLFEKATLSADGKTLTIHWKLQSPGPNDIVTQAFTHPAGVALVDKFEGKVVYKPEPGKDDSPKK